MFLGNTHKASMMLGRTLVTQDLVLNLDASNINSYPGSGSTWYDLSGSQNHATMYGATFNNNYFSFDGSNDYAHATTVKNLGPNVSATVEFVAKAPANAFILGNPRTNSSHGWGTFTFGDYGLRYTTVSRNSNPYSYSMSTSQSLNINNFNYCSLSYSVPARIYSGNMSGKALVNGQTETISAYLYIDANPVFSDIFIGRAYNWIYGNAYYAVDVGLVRIYNRQLTESEQLQNYHYTKMLFPV